MRIGSIGILAALVVLSRASAFAADCVSGVVTTSGSCTIPPRATVAKIEVTGAGGGGGGAAYDENTVSGGGGGGGGNCTLAALSVTAGETLTIVVGTGGYAGANGIPRSPNGGPGTDGGSSSVTYGMTTYSVTGGGGGIGGVAGGEAGPGGAGGVASSCSGGSGSAGSAGQGGGSGGAGGIAAGSIPSPLGYGGYSGESGGLGGQGGAVRLTFSSAPALVPTLSNSALIVLAGLMAVFGIRSVRRH